MQNIQNKLFEFYKKNNLAEKFEKNFWNSFNDYKKEEEKEYNQYLGDYKNIELRFNKLSYELLFPDLGDPKISIIADIYVDSKNIGWYKELYMLTGELFDDFFVVE